jgi:hypothetical protein
LLVILLAIALASSVFIVTHAQHDCIGLGCHTCDQLSFCGLILEWIGLASITVAIPAISRHGAASRREPPLAGARSFTRKTSLFHDHVRLNL